MKSSAPKLGAPQAHTHKNNKTNDQLCTDGTMCNKHKYLGIESGSQSPVNCLAFSDRTVKKKGRTLRNNDLAVLQRIPFFKASHIHAALEMTTKTAFFKNAIEKVNSKIPGLFCDYISGHKSLVTIMNGK